MVPGGPITASPVAAIFERCLDARHRSAGCRRCIDACPADAIVVDDNGPAVDPAACLGCGACMPQCPTQALVAPESMRLLRHAVADVPTGAPVRLACPRGGTSPSWMPTVRYDRCLAALSAEEMLDLAGDEAREVWLDDTHCATCELVRLHPEIERAAVRANQVCAAIGLVSVVRRASVESAVARPAGEGAGRVTDATDGQVSRRGLFRRLVDIGTDSRAVMEAGVPERRQRVLRRLRRWAPVHTWRRPTALPMPGFGVVHIDPERCSACGMCADFCPTKALTFEATPAASGGRTFELTLDASTCIECGLCATACPERALTVDACVDSNTVIRGATLTVASGAMVACSVCGSMTVAGAGTDHRCFSCRRGVVTPLHDEIGLMADLLGRLPKH